MPSPSLFTSAERKSLYACPILTDLERTEYFTFSKNELTVLYRFKKVDHAVYFAISLAFFKLKYTHVRFSYRQVTLERRHVMARLSIPKGFPSAANRVAEIEKNVLDVVNLVSSKHRVASGWRKFGPYVYSKPCWSKIGATYTLGLQGNNCL